MPGRSRHGSSRPPAVFRVTAAVLALSGFATLGSVRLEAEGSAAPPSGAALPGDPAESTERPLALQPLTPPTLIDLSPQVRKLAEEYRDVFATLASGDRTEAVSKAAALETRAFAAHSGKAIEWLSQADGVLLRAYLQARPDCGLPLVLFYQRLVLEHWTQRNLSLVQRALHAADGLLEQVALAASNEGERRLTADADFGFAAGLLTIPAPARAADMLRRGLALAPDDVDATIAFAVLLLRDRRQEEAEKRLDHVLRAHPENREARLRRAQMRVGFSADRRAARELEKLATGGKSDWIALVAAQERVRQLLATGDYDRSIEFLNRVLERFPTDSSLRVALSFAAARSGRRAEAFLAAQSALAAKATPGEGARRIFAELPLRLLRAPAARAATAADARVAGLAAAVFGPASAAPASPVAPATPTPVGRLR